MNKLKNKNNVKKGEPLKVEGKLLTDDEDISNAFNCFYSKRQRLRNDLKKKQKVIRRQINEHCSSQTNDHDIFHRDFEITELREAIRQTKNGKSPGPDNFFPEFIKHLDTKALTVLLKLFNYSWNIGVPAIWKKAIIIPIPKRGKPLEDLNSYRPISLTCVLSKVIPIKLKAMQRF